MDQKESEQYWEIFKTKVQPLAERKQRIIAYRFCLLVEKDLDDLGKGALKLVEQLASGHVPVQTCKAYQELLQNKLPEINASPYSPLIWALTPHTDSYPAWYSAALAGLNIVELEIATLRELTDLVKEILNGDKVI